jgi:TonB family protein
MIRALSEMAPNCSSFWASFFFSSCIHVGAIFLILFSPLRAHYGIYKAPQTFMVSLIEAPSRAREAGLANSTQPVSSPKPMPMEKKRISPPPELSKRESKGREIKEAKVEKAMLPPEPRPEPKAKEAPPARMVIPSAREAPRRLPTPSASPAAPVPFALPPLPSVTPGKETAQAQREGSAAGATAGPKIPAVPALSPSKTGGSSGGGSTESGREGGMLVGVASSLPGVSVDNPDFQFTYYLVIIQNKIASNWSPPYAGGKPGGVQKTVIGFRILRNGTVQDVRVENSSGASFMDQSAVRAISRSSPLPPLPQRFLDESIGVHLSFWLEGGKG